MLDLAGLKRKSVRGGTIMLAGQAVSIAIQLASTVILARLLAPDDYGIMAMVLAVTAFAGLFRDLGLSAAAIQKKDLTREQQSNLFWFNVVMGVLLTIVMASASPLVAWLYKRPEVLWVTVALSFKFLIGSFGTQHGARLVREMQFARKVAAGIGGSLVSLGLSIVLALQGFSYWALVWGGIAGEVMTTSLLFALSPFRPGLPSRGGGVRDMLKFGAHITAFDFVNYFHRNLDNILIGRFWGAEALGLYSRAYSLLMFPINAIRSPITAVAFPAMSKLQNEPAAFRAYYRRVTSVVAFLSMPVTAFLFASSRSLVELALGKQWLGVVPIFTILAIVGFIQPVASLRGLVLMSLGNSRKYFVWGLINACVVSLGIAIGVKWGPVGVACGYAAATYGILQPSMMYVFHGTPLTSSDFWKAIVRPAIASAASCILLLLLEPLVAGSKGIVVQLFMDLIVFGISFLTLYFLMPGGLSEVKFILAAAKSGSVADTNTPI